jgi:hypothetical protein
MGKPAVFIIESVKRQEEEDNIREGQIIEQILHLGNIEYRYYYVRTRRELEKFVKEFGKSDFKYLHLSCHGGTDCIATAFDPTITFEELRDILKPYIANKRLFVSACNATNDRLAKAVIPSTHCLSIIGFNKIIDFDEAAIFWASFYYLMFKAMSQADASKMDRDEILRTLRSLSRAFRIPINYFSSSRKPPGYKLDRIGFPQA